MKKLFIIICVLFFFFSSFAIAEVAPDSFDRFDIPKESMVDPFFRGNDCMVSHAEAAFHCYETVRCLSQAVTEYAVLMEYYFDESGQVRTKINFWEYVIAGETYRFELNEEKKIYKRK